MRRVTTYTSSSSSSEDHSQRSPNCNQNNDNFLDLSAFLPSLTLPLIIQPQTPQSLGTNPVFSEVISEGKWHVNGGNVTFNETGDYLITINMWFQQGVPVIAPGGYGAASTFITINGDTYANVLKRSSASASIVFLPDFRPINHTTSTFIVSLKRDDVVGFWATSLQGKQGAEVITAVSSSVLEDPNLPGSNNAPWYHTSITRL